MSEARPDFLVTRWLLVLFLIWLTMSGYLIFSGWNAIHWFSLPDTDDNMRMMQVRALLHGQDWFDLRQHRMNPPVGANIHWSHLVDLPIAAIILAVKPFFGGAVAEKAAVAIAPLLPLGVALFGLGLTARRIVAPGAYLLIAALFLTSIPIIGMFRPLRIDHHGWQLALLTLLLAGLVDEKRLRGGLTIGVATALSLVIGLETLPWLAVAAGGIGLRWIIDGNQSPRLLGYAMSLGGGVAAGFLLFGSYDNWVARCDALTPIWVSVMTVTSAVFFLLSVLKIEKRPVRIVLLGIAGLIVALFFVVAWPECLGRPEQVSPELERLWLNNVSEAKPIYTRNWATILAASSLLIGLFGSFWAFWKNRGSERGAAWAAIALLSLGSGLLTLWQARAAPTALLMSMPGAAAIGWAILPKLRAHRSIFVRVFGVVLVFFAISSLGMQFIGGMVPDREKQTPGMKRVAKANAACPTIPALRPIALMPRATILTFVDLGPRLITVTHHDAIAGPYHRNGDAILDVQKAFRGTPDYARAVARKHGATLLLLCPYMSESTIYKAEAPKGFYVQLMQGKIPDWLEPVPLPKRSPFLLWRIKP